uniref:Uncharacterized protein n=1 Tax=Panagrolaimus superbus TaxID=310955 RepID=A0A914Z1M4_9BILA
MLERNRRRGGSKYSKKCCQTTCLLIITAMNLIGVIVLIILFACHKAQEFRRNPPIFTSTLSFEQLPPFPSTHFTRLTSDATHQLLRTEFFENHQLPQAIWIFSDNLRTAPCCEIETALTPTVYHEFTAPEESYSSSEPFTFEFSQPQQYTESMPPQYPPITVSLPKEDSVNDYFSGWGVTAPSTESYFTKEKSQNVIFTGNLKAKQLISNQIDRIIGPPSIKPSTDNFEIENKRFMEEEKLTSKSSPPSTAPNEFQLNTLNEKNTFSSEGGDYGETNINDNNIVTDLSISSKNLEKISSDEKEMNAKTQSTKTKESKIDKNVLLGIPKGII